MMAKSRKKSEKTNKDTGKKNKKSGKVTTRKTRKTTREKVKPSTKNTSEIESPVEKPNIAHTNDRAGDAAESEIVSAADEQTDNITEASIEDNDAIVSFIETEKNIESDNQPGGVSKVVAEDPDEIVSFKEEDVSVDSQTDSSAEPTIEDSDEIEIYSEKAEDDTQTDKLKDGEPEDVVVGIVNTENHTDNTHDTQTGKQENDSIIKLENEEEVENLAENESEPQVDKEVETDIEGEVEKFQTGVPHYKTSTRTKKTVFLIPVILMIAAVVLLLVAFIERRSAKKALIQANLVADAIKQMREESLKEREQIIHFQIDGRALVIDALLLTRNGLELELANTDEKEVKRIIGVFINDIDERTKKIKSEITSLRNKLKKIN